MRPAFCSVMVAVLVLAATGEGLAGDFLTAQRRYGRVAAAWKDHHADVRARFREAGAAWPPSGVFLRAFKADGVLELWASPERGTQRVLVRTFPICAASGVLGPKSRAGDGQVPEGFYAITRFNPHSSYHLSLGLDYPNAYDRARAGTAPPGGDIFIHGSCVTIGCLPLEDAPVSWLYLVAVLAKDGGQRQLPAHVFPCRFEDAACARDLAERGADAPALGAFWEGLRPGYDAFAREGRPPRMRVTAAGYAVVPER